MEEGGPRSVRRVGEDEGGGPDRISDLPDAVLGDIISLLPTKEGAWTRILASRWRNLWRSAPLNLDCDDLSICADEVGGVISRILSSHQGLGRCFGMPWGPLPYGEATVDSWLQSSTVDNLQELRLCYPTHDELPLRLPLLSESFLRFSTTLRVATIENCHLLDSIVQGFQFPQLRQLTLQYVKILECSMPHVIAGCPVLECLMIKEIYGLRCLRINSISLRSIGVRALFHQEDEIIFEQLIIENAPCLEKLLHLHLHVSVIFAPKLETMGCSSIPTTKISFGSMVIQGKKTGPNNLWLRKHKNTIRCHDIRLKKIVFEMYSGIKSQVSFLTFFVLNARVLELMTLRVQGKNYSEELLGEHRRKLQLENRASRGARFQVTTDKCMNGIWNIEDAHDLDLADPFRC